MRHNTIPTSNYSPKIEQIIIKGTRNKQTFIWKVPLETQQSKIAVKHIMSQTTKPELAQYFHATPFIPTQTSLLKAIKIGFIKTCIVLTEGIIKNHI